MKRFWKSGEPCIWLTGCALDVALILVAGLLLLILWNGAGFFWPEEVVRLRLKDGSSLLGQVTEREVIPQPGAPLGTPVRHRIQLKQGNRDSLGVDFIWVDEDQILEKSAPDDAVIVERREWGNAYGILRELKDGDTTIAASTGAWAALVDRLPSVHETLDRIRAIEKGELGVINAREERMRLDRVGREQSGAASTDSNVERREAELRRAYGEAEARALALKESLTLSTAFELSSGTQKLIPLAQIVRVYQPNTMSGADKLGFYLAKVWEFVSDDPRESNTEGGIFPAIFGTVLLVLFMSVLVTPLGVLAAFYLREYAKQGPLVSIVRIAVNNLAGVPSIVFGVFGVGFFIYFLGGGIDRLFFADSLPTPTFGTGGILWASLTLSLLTVPVVVVATEEGLAAIPRGVREASLALGATRFETSFRVVLPAVMPSVLTGLILAMARAAGEVAPLMITGVVKFAPSLGLDGTFPFVHLDRKFMHLGFHIYDVGFQAPNVDAARPMVFTTTMLLVLIILVLNLTAIVLRTRLRKKYSLTSL